ncbi:MAG: hypothetical protein Q9191_006896 [Dirinaria sp. TL-2023a]
MHFSLPYTAAALALGATASPINELDSRNLTPEECSKVVVIVDVLKLHKATPFCSSFLSIKPATSTSTVLVTASASTTTTATITSGTASTSIVFKPGNPPTAKAKARREPETIQERAAAAAPEPVPNGKTPTPAIPAYATTYAPSAISSACHHKNNDRLKDSFPTRHQLDLLSENSLYGSNTAGDSLEGCCNLCFFGVPNCIQAFYYFYEGCVIQQASAPTGTGVGVSDVCPQGQIAGLTYSRDDTADPPFRSTGDIAGPCGAVYDDL